ncbi:MAG: GntR family transcriptional regulator [Clostridia bacterium]|nr:GntR family transcriptional regulator [Clostridia bacterium]
MLKKNVYENIVEEIKKMILVGAVKAGEKLPSVREYAVERKVNPNTVAKAYAELEAEGYIYVLPKKGAFVKGETGGNFAKPKIGDAVLAWKEAGISKEEIALVLERVYGGNI